VVVTEREAVTTEVEGVGIMAEEVLIGEEEEEATEAIEAQIEAETEEIAVDLAMIRLHMTTRSRSDEAHRNERQREKRKRMEERYKERKRERERKRKRKKEREREREETKRYLFIESHAVINASTRSMPCLAPFVTETDDRLDAIIEHGCGPLDPRDRIMFFLLGAELFVADDDIEKEQL